MVQLIANMLLLAALTASPILSTVSATPYPYGEDFRGDGTYYGNVSPGEGNCALEEPLPSMYDGMIPFAVSLDHMYDDSVVCGACIEGSGTGDGSGRNPIKGKFKGFVSDSCPECAKGDLDFAKAGDGRWDITWKFVKCPGGDDPSFIFEGSNEWYWKIQPRETKSPVTQLWVDGVEAKRTQDNFFIASSGPYHGEQLVKTKTMYGKTKKTHVAL